MSLDPLDAERHRARTVMASARDRAVSAMHATAERAFLRADDGVRAATTPAEIERAQDLFIAGIDALGATAHG
ncbi:MAG: hypothetical protein K2Y40_02565 [Reyranella sp.]|nr:hypothetical protein [Reyranella sp.]